LSEPPRPAQRVLIEYQGVHTLRATDALYEEQPDLWRLGENGRMHTFDDFAHHFASLTTLDIEVFASHVRFCNDLFSQRGFPLRWLTDAWRIMQQVLERELPPALAQEAIETVRAGVLRSEVPA